MFGCSNRELAHKTGCIVYSYQCSEQSQKWKGQKLSNSSQFELYLNNDEILVIEIKPGAILIYSGFMLMHRQQIIHTKNTSVC